MVKKMMKDVKSYIEEEADSSIHELIRENVLLATRFFDHRVKKFITSIVMGANNPMIVEFYSYKVEFQERGAAHVHGLLWLALDKMEKLVRVEKNRLVLPDFEDDQRDAPF